MNTLQCAPPKQLLAKFQEQAGNAGEDGSLLLWHQAARVLVAWCPGKVDSGCRQIVADWFSNSQHDLSQSKNEIFATLQLWSTQSSGCFQSTWCLNYISKDEFKVTLYFLGLLIKAMHWLRSSEWSPLCRGSRYCWMSVLGGSGGGGKC